MKTHILLACATLIALPAPVAFAQTGDTSNAPKETATMPDTADQSHQEMVKKPVKAKKHKAKQKL